MHVGWTCQLSNDSLIDGFQCGWTGVGLRLAANRCYFIRCEPHSAMNLKLLALTERFCRVHDIQWWPWHASCHYVVRSPSPSSAASAGLDHHSAPAFALKTRHIVNRALRCSCQINMVDISCLKIRFGVVLRMFEKAKFLADWGGWFSYQGASIILWLH